MRKNKKNAYRLWGVAIIAKIYCPTHYFQSQWDWTGPRSSYLPWNVFQVPSLVESILGLIVLKPPRAVPFSGPPSQGSRHIANFCQESVRMCWNNPQECVCVPSFLDIILGWTSQNGLYLGRKGRFGPKQLPKMPHSVGPPPRWCCRSFKFLCGGAPEIGLAKYGWPLQPKF